MHVDMNSAFCLRFIKFAILIKSKTMTVFKIEQIDLSTDNDRVIDLFTYFIAYQVNPNVFFILSYVLQSFV